MAAGDELLIADSHTTHAHGLRRLFDEAGYVVTVASSISAARDLLEDKFFPAALVDLDLERSSGGLDLLRFIRERSKATSVVVLTVRRTFEGAVEALRLGASDLVLKQADQVPHLKRAVAVACDRFRAQSGDDAILRDVHRVLDESFRVMLKLAHQYYHDISVGAEAGFRPRVLVVDGEQDFLQQLAQRLGHKDWEVAAEMTGGSALDKAGTFPFDIVVARDDLMDLKGSMVIKTIQASRAETMGIVYSAAGEEGRLERYDQGRPEDAERPFRGVDHLLERLEQVVDRLGATQRDRRVIQAFRSDHEEFFRRYAELKMRVSNVVD